MELRLVFKYFWFFISLFFLQLALFNNFVLWNEFYPFVLILFLLLLPFDLENWIVIAVAFVLGIIYDMFNNSLALHTSSLLIIGLLRNFILKTIAPKDGYDLTLFPSAYNYGFKWFAIYSLILIFIFEFFDNFMDYLQIGKIIEILYKSLINTILTFIFIVVLHLIFYKNKH